MPERCDQMLKKLQDWWLEVDARFPEDMRSAINRDPMRNKSIVFLLLRISLGWHFLYEGVTKIIDPHWTAEAYLRASYGIFSSFFHFLSSGPGMIAAVDFLNEWGLILIGSALILGVFVRTASVSGIVLLMLYYFAYPPFGNQSADIVSEGHYWIINRNLIEALVFMIIYLFPSSDYSVLNISSFYRKRTLSPAPDEKVEENRVMNRRDPDQRSCNSTGIWRYRWCSLASGLYRLIPML